MDSKITIQLSREKGIQSSIIAWASHGGGFSHVDAVSGSHGNLYGARSDRVGGKPPGVHLRPAGYAPFIHRAVFDIPCTDKQRTDFWGFLWEQDGKPYDYLGILGVIRDRDFENPKAWFCSRLIFAAMLKCGRIAPEYIPDGLITPRDVALTAGLIGGRLVYDSSAEFPRPATISIAAVPGGT